MIYNRRTVTKYNKNMKKILSFLVLSLLSALTVKAQYASDPTQALGISGDGILSGQTDVKAKQAPDGNIFVLWGVRLEDSSTSPYRLRAQLLDKDGNKLWGDDGKSVCENEADPYMPGHGMDVTEDGCLVFTSNDNRTGSDKIYAYCIDQEGNQVWGKNGVALPGGVSWLTDKTEVLSHGGYTYITYLGGDDGETQAADWLCKLDNKSGEIIWQKEVENDGTLVPGDDKGFIMGYKTPETMNIAKFDYDGNELWNTVLEDDFSTRMVGYQYMSFAPDGKGGCVTAYGWEYATDTFGNPLYAIALQHVSADGQILTGDTPVEAAENVEGTNVFPITAYDPETDNMLVAWFQDNLAHKYTLYAGKYGKDGKKMWQPDGNEILVRDEMGGFEIEPLALIPTGKDEWLMVYNNQTKYTENQLVACRLSASGEILWSKNIGPADYNEYLRQGIVVGEQEIYAFWSRDDVHEPIEGTGVMGHRMFIDGTFEPTGIENTVVNNDGISIRYDSAADMIYADGITDGTICIYDLQGVLSASDRISEMGINISSLSKGIYIVRATDGNGSTATTKISVKH